MYLLENPLSHSLIIAHVEAEATFVHFHFLNIYILLYHPHIQLLYTNPFSLAIILCISPLAHFHFLNFFYSIFFPNPLALADFFVCMMQMRRPRLCSAWNRAAMRSAARWPTHCTRTTRRPSPRAPISFETSPAAPQAASDLTFTMPRRRWPHHKPVI